MFILTDWIIFGFIALAMILIAWGACASWCDEKKTKVIIIVVEIIGMALIMFGCAMYNTHTESGKRGVKTWGSEVNGGLNRTVVVYDINGNEIARYKGKFDIQETTQEGVVKVKFDCEGKRHIIYAQTGTVLIDEE